MDLGPVVQHEAHQHQGGREPGAVILVEDALLAGRPAGDPRVENLEPAVAPGQPRLELAHEGVVDRHAVAEGDRIAQDEDAEGPGLGSSHLAVAQAV